MYAPLLPPNRWRQLDNIDSKRGDSKSGIPNFILKLFETMKIVLHNRDDSMSSISMDGDWIDAVPSSRAELRSQVESPSDTAPRVLLFDGQPSANSSPTDIGTLPHEKSDNSSNGPPFRVSLNLGSHFTVVQDVDFQYIHSPPYERPSPKRRPSHRHAYGDSPFSSFKPSRYSLGVLGEDNRSQSCHKSNMSVRKMFANTRTVLPLHESRSEAKPKLHRRDSFASLPKIADIGISNDDLIDIGTPTG